MDSREKDSNVGFCNTIRLHNINSIQPHAALLVVNLINFHLIQISSNVSEWLGLPIKNILGQSLEKIIENSCIVNIKEKHRENIFKNVIAEYLTFTTGPSPETYLGRIHEKENYLLIEVEFINDISEKKPFVNAYKQLQEIAASIGRCTSVQELATTACKEIKRASGFDKVMVYTFDEKWNGLVIGEAMEDGMEQYLGLKFPATDVPKQARDLYLRNSYRIIPNRSYKKVTLIPDLNPLTNGPTDLTDVKSRSVVDVHLEYLANMQVEASMSTRIIHNELLWGLIACHHRTTKLLSFEECAVFEMISNVISSKLSSLLNQRRADEHNALDTLLREIDSKMLSSDNPLDLLKSYGSEITRLLGGDGSAVCWQGKIITAGVTPDEDQVMALLPWLRARGFTSVVNITSLANEFEPARDYPDKASGLLILPIQPYEDNYILAFKMEAIKTVSWGGNPDNAITFEKNSSKYRPRNSFASWSETVRLTSNPWSDEQLRAAERFRNVVVENTLKRLTSTLEQHVKERTHELAVSNENLSHALNELEELTHITSHDLQEPVRKILLFANELDQQPDPGKNRQYIDKIVRASRRISSLIIDLVNISGIRSNKMFLKCDLQIVVETVLAQYREAIVEHDINVIVGKLPVVDAVQEQMEQLFTKIIDNAIKFRSPKGKSQIEIKGDFVSTFLLDSPEDKSGKFVRVAVKDNGIGFNDNYAAKVFRIFKTLHPGQYGGTGSSMAISRRIVESHGGRIFAYGKEDEGAVFTIILPVVQ